MKTKAESIITGGHIFKNRVNAIYFSGGDEMPTCNASLHSIVVASYSDMPSCKEQFF